MATTRIIPLHTGKGRSFGRAISDIIDYVENPEKTAQGQLITGFACESRCATQNFFLQNGSTFERPAECGARTM